MSQCQTLTSRSEVDSLKKRIANLEDILNS